MRNFSLFFMMIFVSVFQNSIARADEAPAAIFRQANSAYREGEFPRATSLYESLLKQGWGKAGVYYNLGNAYFKEKRFGLAILNYEKAKRLSPRDRDILRNLNYSKSLLEYRIQDKRNWYLRTAEALLLAFTKEEIGILTLSVCFLFLVSWAVGLYFYPFVSWGWKRKALLILALGCLTFWALKRSHDASPEAIVLASQASVRYGPSYKDQVAFRLGEGIKVRIKNKEGEWSQVVLTNGETGWMYQEEIGII